MTLCVAWVRNAIEPHELFFATDSRLRGLGVWDSGIKLFELKRAGCLIAFHGGTELAYTLLNHLNHNLLARDEFQSSHCDVHDLALPLASLFSELASGIADYPGNIEEDKGGTGFLFGGWSWRQAAFALWRVDYDLARRCYQPDPVAPHVGRVFSFIGGVEDKPGEAASELNSLAPGPKLDLEPLSVLSRRVLPNQPQSSVGGPVQLARIHRSGIVEFLGVLWNGRPNLRCRELSAGEMPEVQLLDLQTGEEVSGLPQRFANWQAYDFGADAQFLERCFGQNGGALAGDLQPEERRKLARILRQTAYTDFLRRLEVVGTEVSSAEHENE
ncbi:MAG: hypothetical protein L0387_14285 [Acidobacteria bacterium]|nr:hypothetical protein [Acidobacteriota bacterium]MCI0622803.1 hypothetical protein [Acidobacteriota bacterium]MCI0723101.1 hypothetical protein [Acidobacteriota bacterium]